jgi:hypothetical protein
MDEVITDKYKLIKKEKDYKKAIQEISEGIAKNQKIEHALEDKSIRFTKMSTHLQYEFFTTGSLSPTIPLKLQFTLIKAANESESWINTGIYLIGNKYN